jgi:hypothetical protein
MKYTTDFLSKRCSIESLKAIQLLLATGKTPHLNNVIMDIVENIKGNERLTIYLWGDDVWYLEVQDLSIPCENSSNYPLKMRFWVTFDVKRDIIVKNNEKVMGDGILAGAHGNCGLRSRKWHKFVKARFPHWVADKEYHKYRFAP